MLTGQRLLGALVIALWVGSHPTTQSDARGRRISYRLDPSPPAAAVAAVPAVVLGGAHSDLVLHGVAAVRRQQSGRLVVANTDPPTVLIFEKGRLVATLGRRGTGPGEFEELTNVALLPQDSIVALDRMLRRITVFDADGRFARTVQLESPFSWPPFNITLEALRDGSLAVGFVQVPPTRPSRAVVEARIHLERYSTRGSRLNSIGEFFYSEHFHQATPRSFGGGSAFWERAFGRRGVLLAVGNTILAGDATRMSFSRVSSRGEVTEVHTLDVPRTRLSASRIARYKETEISDEKPEDRGIEALRVEQMPYPTFLPAFRRVAYDERERVWVEGYDRGTGPGQVWTVLETATGRATRVWLPSGFEPHVVTAAEVVGVRKDADRVESVEVYRLLR